MTTNTSTPVFKIQEEGLNVTVLRYEPREATQGDFMRQFRRLVKWLGLPSTMIWAALAFIPDMFNVPLGLRPWAFLTFIFWFVAFCAGMFNL